MQFWLFYGSLVFKWAKTSLSILSLILLRELCLCVEACCCVCVCFFEVLYFCFLLKKFHNGDLLHIVKDVVKHHFIHLSRHPSGHPSIPSWSIYSDGAKKEWNTAAWQRIIYISVVNFYFYFYFLF